MVILYMQFTIYSYLLVYTIYSDIIYTYVWLIRSYICVCVAMVDTCMAMVDTCILSDHTVYHILTYVIHQRLNYLRRYQLLNHMLMAV